MPIKDKVIFFITELLFICNSLYLLLKPNYVGRQHASSIVFKSELDKHVHVLYVCAGRTGKQIESNAWIWLCES